MLEITDVRVSYGACKALKGVTLSVEAGSVVGVVGPNGAGKSTLFKAVMGMVELDAGAVSLDGRPLFDIESREVGYLADIPFQFEFLTPREMLLFERAMKNPELPLEHLQGLLHTLDLEAHENTPIGNLSQGLRKRAALAAALAGEPSLLVLDKPLNALDVQTVIVLKRLIREAVARGAHVLVSSHVLNFFDGLVDKVAFLDRGLVRHVCSGDGEGAEDTYRRLFMDGEL